MTEHFERGINRIRVPDDDMAGWIEAIREMNLSEEETNRILSYLNENYRKMIGGPEEKMDTSFIDDDPNLSDVQKALLRKLFGYDK